ncbi:N-6 DNA methylase, partial [Pseudomonas aeruginosa]|uniref:N-6 DNA methylase n=1 Tax=Pseudomonas aeruginosa TaxID=287 RepID=UPI003D188D6D
WWARRRSARPVGESNIRRHIIENDLLEAIIQLPNNLFYNTGITTYIWLLSSNKPAQRRGKVQLIDAACSTASCARTSVTRTASSPPSISS